MRTQASRSQQVQLLQRLAAMEQHQEQLHADIRVLHEQLSTGLSSVAEAQAVEAHHGSFDGQGRPDGAAKVVGFIDAREFVDGGQQHSAGSKTVEHRRHALDRTLSCPEFVSDDTNLRVQTLQRGQTFAVGCGNPALERTFARYGALDRTASNHEHLETALGPQTASSQVELPEALEQEHQDQEDDVRRPQSPVSSEGHFELGIDSTRLDMSTLTSVPRIKSSPSSNNGTSHHDILPSVRRRLFTDVSTLGDLSSFAEDKTSGEVLHDISTVLEFLLRDKEESEARFQSELQAIWQDMEASLQQVRLDNLAAQIKAEGQKQDRSECRRDCISNGSILEEYPALRTLENRMHDFEREVRELHERIDEFSPANNALLLDDSVDMRLPNDLEHLLRRLDWLEERGAAAPVDTVDHQQLQQVQNSVCELLKQFSNFKHRSSSTEAAHTALQEQVQQLQIALERRESNDTGSWPSFHELQAKVNTVSQQVAQIDARLLEMEGDFEFARRSEPSQTSSISAGLQERLEVKQESVSNRPEIKEVLMERIAELERRLPEEHESAEATGGSSLGKQLQEKLVDKLEIIANKLEATDELVERVEGLERHLPATVQNEMCRIHSTSSSD